MTLPKENLVKNQKGQTFLEFVLILAFLLIASSIFLKSFTYFIGSRWEVMLKIIAMPNGGDVNFP